MNVWLLYSCHNRTCGQPLVLELYLLQIVAPVMVVNSSSREASKKLLGPNLVSLFLVYSLFLPPKLVLSHVHGANYKHHLLAFGALLVYSVACLYFTYLCGSNVFLCWVFGRGHYLAIYVCFFLLELYIAFFLLQYFPRTIQW